MRFVSVAADAGVARDTAAEGRSCGHKVTLKSPTIFLALLESAGITVTPRYSPLRLRPAFSMKNVCMPIHVYEKRSDARVTTLEAQQSCSRKANSQTDICGVSQVRQVTHKNGAHSQPAGTVTGLLVLACGTAYVLV